MKACSGIANVAFCMSASFGYWYVKPIAYERPRILCCEHTAHPQLQSNARRNNDQTEDRSDRTSIFKNQGSLRLSALTGLPEHVFRVGSTLLAFAKEGSKEAVPLKEVEPIRPAARQTVSVAAGYMLSLNLTDITHWVIIGLMYSRQPG